MFFFLEHNVEWFIVLFIFRTHNVEWFIFGFFSMLLVFIT